MAWAGHRRLGSCDNEDRTICVAQSAACPHLGSTSRRRLRQAIELRIPRLPSGTSTKSEIAGGGSAEVAALRDACARCRRAGGTISSVPFTASPTMSPATALRLPICGAIPSVRLPRDLARCRPRYAAIGAIIEALAERFRPATASASSLTAKRASRQTNLREILGLVFSKPNSYQPVGHRRTPKWRAMGPSQRAVGWRRVERPQMGSLAVVFDSGPSDFPATPRRRRRTLLTSPTCATCTAMTM